MSAIDWRSKFGNPRLGHDNGYVFVELDGCSIVFPSEAAARFFFEACTELPALVEQNAHLRQQIDEKALNEALSAQKALAAELEEMKRQQVVLKTQLAEIAEKAATAGKRARILAIAIKNKIVP